MTVWLASAAANRPPASMRRSPAWLVRRWPSVTVPAALRPSAPLPASTTVSPLISSAPLPARNWMAPLVVVRSPRSASTRPLAASSVIAPAAARMAWLSVMPPALLRSVTALAPAAVIAPSSTSVAAGLHRHRALAAADDALHRQAAGVDHVDVTAGLDVERVDVDAAACGPERDALRRLDDQRIRVGQALHHHAAGARDQPHRAGAADDLADDDVAVGFDVDVAAVKRDRADRQVGAARIQLQQREVALAGGAGPACSAARSGCSRRWSA